MDKEMVKVDDLSPASKRVNIVVKVLDVGEPKEVPSKMGGSRTLAEARVGDETGTVLMTLWQDQIEQVSPGDVLLIDNGFMSLVRGHLRLNVGRYGSMSTVDEDIPEVKEDVDMSEREYESTKRFDRRSDFGERRGGRGRGRR
jgi:replication factor A1